MPPSSRSQIFKHRQTWILAIQGKLTAVLQPFNPNLAQTTLVAIDLIPHFEGLILITQSPQAKAQEVTVHKAFIGSIISLIEIVEKITGFFPTSQPGQNGSKRIA